MRLYHGSNLEINDVDFSQCRPYKDFGKGFYTTEIKEQADKMSVRVSNIYGGSPFVTEFDFDESALNSKELNIRVFDKPDREWALFVMNNRNRRAVNLDCDCNFDNRYDIVIGPIADDDLALLFRQFENDLIDVESLVRKMKYKKLTNQISFHTERSLQYLKKVGARDE